MRLRALTFATACALGGASVARAAPAAEGFRLDVAPSCSRIDAAQLGRLLNIEQRRGADSIAADVLLSVSCSDRIATLRASRRGDARQPRERELALADVAGEVGARVLSLAAIELLNDLESAPPAPEPSPALEPEPEPEPVLEPPIAPPARAPSVRLMAAGGLHSFELERPLAGGGIAVDYLRLARLGLRLQFDVAAVGRDYDLGAARVLLTTLSAQAGYLTLQDSWTARAFVGYRFGSGRIAGERAPGSSAREGVVSGAFGGPLLSLGLGARSGGWVGELGAEAGLVSFPLEGRVDSERSIRLDGYWLGVSLSVGALL